jgi:nicotinamidase-related amidase
VNGPRVKAAAVDSALWRMTLFAAFAVFFCAPAAATCAPGTTPLDSNVALIAIDLQHSILERSTPLPVDQLLDHARPLLDMFRSLGKPVVLVRSSRQPPGRIQQNSVGSMAVDPHRSELLSGLGQIPSDHVIEKAGWSAFTKTDLATFLARRHVTQVVLLGYSTTIAVEATARDAYDRGYNVTILGDAITDSDVAGHDWALSKLFPRLGVIVASGELLRCLENAD